MKLIHYLHVHALLTILSQHLPPPLSLALSRHLMMNVGSPKLLVISDTNQELLEAESEDEELNFQPHVTPREKLMNSLHRFFQHVFLLLQLLVVACLQRIGRGRGRGRVGSSENADKEVGAEEEGRSTGSLDHTPFREEPEVTSEALQMEMEAATPLPGETITSPPKSAMWAPQETKPVSPQPEELKDDMDPSSVPLPSSQSTL